MSADVEKNILIFEDKPDTTNTNAVPVPRDPLNQLSLFKSKPGHGRKLQSKGPKHYDSQSLQFITTSGEIIHSTDFLGSDMGARPYSWSSVASRISSVRVVVVNNWGPSS